MVVCRGRVGKRAAFNWNQDREAVYPRFLIEFWHRNALHWSSKVFSLSPVQAATKQARFQTQFCLRFAVRRSDEEMTRVSPHAMR